MAVAAMTAALVSVAMFGLLVAVVGSVALWLKIASLDAAPRAAVNALPLDDRLALGLQALALPTAAAGLAVLVLLIGRRRGSQAQQRNAGGLAPWGLVPVLIGLVVATLGVAVTSEATDVAVVGMVLAAGAGSYGVYELVRMTNGLIAGLCLVGLAVAALGTGFQLLYAAVHPARLDMAAVVRSNGTAVGAFVLGRSSDEVALLVVDPGRTTGGGGVTALPSRQCDGTPSTRSDPCYANVVSIIPGSLVKAFYAGPRDARVTRAMYLEAREFATRALTGALDAQP